MGCLSNIRWVAKAPAFSSSLRSTIGNLTIKRTNTINKEIIAKIQYKEIHSKFGIVIF